MATGNQPAPSRPTDNFTKIFKDAAKGYETITGEPIEAHPFASKLGICKDPKAVLTIFTTQTVALNKLCDEDTRKRLKTWSKTIVDVVLTFSNTLSDGFDLVSNPLRPVPTFSNIWFTDILARKNSPYRFLCSSSGMPLIYVHCRTCVTFNLTPAGNESCHIEPRHPSSHPPLRAHQLLPRTPERLH